jgi:hypothetical protein
LFIKEEYRGLGIAKELFRQLGVVAEEKVLRVSSFLATA